ncbi:GreA/GreB family elongation factor [Leeuwenhoekiella sp. MAR_2009_132]|uniref:GreA/GreB family elongation factor n=1 Tax=Leeuwenhoekiella sp. MAR_2009_132 TaxID=1392489 RepID=UPI00048A8DFB|nr:GreA/GreB family elongation factor [Leeuwenhoekiella sp. MAR_2009_132]
MKYGSLILEKKEYVLLKRIMNISYHLDDPIIRDSIHKLNEELQLAMICEDIDVPADVVRFNSKVTVESSEQTHDLYIVPPAQSNLLKKRISVMSPLGAALMGFSEGDEVLGDFPDGSKRVLIKAVLQQDTSIDTTVL